MSIVSDAAHGSGTAKRDGGRPLSDSTHKRFNDDADEFTDSFDGGDLNMPSGSGGNKRQRKDTDAEESMQGNDDDSSGDEGVLAIQVAVTTFKAITGKDIRLDVAKVDMDGEGLYRLFFQHFQDIPWSTIHFPEYLDAATAENAPFPFLVRTAKDVLGCDAALFLRMVNNVDLLIKKFDSIQVTELQTKDLNQVEKGVEDLKRIVSNVLQDKSISFLDRIDTIKADAQKVIMAADFKVKQVDKTLNKIRAEVSKQCRALNFSSGRSKDFDTIVSKFIALFDVWMYIREKKPEHFDAANDDAPEQGTSSDAAVVKHDQLKATADMIALFKKIQDQMPGMADAVNRDSRRGQQRGKNILNCDADCLNCHCIEFTRKRSIYLQQLDSKARQILMKGPKGHVYKTFGSINDVSLRLLRVNEACMLEAICDIFDYVPMSNSKEGKDSVHNLTDLVLQDNQLELLSFGSSFIQTPMNVTSDELCRVFEELQYRTLRKYMFKGVTKTKLLKERSKEFIIQDLKVLENDPLAKSIKKSLDPMVLTNLVMQDIISIKPNLSLREETGLKELKKLIHDKDLMLIESDKNMGLCLIERSKYHAWLFNEINKLDKSFTVSDLTASGQEELIKESVQLRNMINALFKKHFNQEDLRSCMTRYLNNNPEPILPVIKGMPKLHKEGNRMRIILPFDLHVFTQIHNVIAAVLTPLAQRIKTALISSLELIHDLEPRTFDGNFYIVSADLDSMYNRIDLKVAVDLILDFMHEYKEEFLIFGNNHLTNDYVWRTIIMKSFEKCNFRCSEKTIRQSYGVAMGSPAGPLIATIYINRIIMKNIARRGNTFQMIKFWRMYIDDGFFIFDAANDPDQIKNILHDLISYEGSELKWDDKSFHIKSINAMINDPIVFLDTQIKSRAGEGDLYHLLFSVYCKPIGSYQYIHRRSCHPLSCMKSIAYAEALRRLRLSTQESDYERSLNDLRIKLMRRGHRLKHINDQIAKVPFSSRQTAMQGTLDKFERKRDPSINTNPLRKERTNRISNIIPMIIRYDPRIFNALKRVKNNIQNVLRTSLVNRDPFGQIRIILAWKKNLTMVNKIMKSKGHVKVRDRPFLSNPEEDQC